MVLDLDAVGTRGPEIIVGWTVDDALLYAVAVGIGAKDPTRGLALTTENTEGVEQQVLPSFGAVLAQRAPRPDIGEFDRSKLVHAEQGFELHRPLPVEGRMTAQVEIVAIEDKRSGALVQMVTTCRDVEAGMLVLTAHSSTFIRGEGGIGDRGEVHRAGARNPQRPADAVVEHQVRPEQALLYRLTGDRNPLHTDPAFAARGGFDRPILHGMCTYGIAAGAIVEQRAPDQASALRRMDGRFTAPVWPGDLLRISLWDLGDGELAFRVHREDTVVIDRGNATVATA